MTSGGDDEAVCARAVRPSFEVLHEQPGRWPFLDGETRDTHELAATLRHRIATVRT